MMKSPSPYLWWLLLLILAGVKSHPNEQALLEAYVAAVETAPCGCVGCCPPPVPKCCDPRCPKCIGGDVPYPGKRCQFACPGGGCPNQCPCDACVCCYTTYEREFETTTCLDQAVLFFIGLEVSTVHIYESLVETVTSTLTFNAGEVFIYTSVQFSTLTLASPFLTSTATVEETTFSTVSVGLNTFTVLEVTTAVMTAISDVVTTPTAIEIIFDPSSTRVLESETFTESILGDLYISTTDSPTIVDFHTLSTFVTATVDVSTVPVTITEGFGDYLSTLSLLNYLQTTRSEATDFTVTVDESNTFTSTELLSTETISETISDLGDIYSSSFTFSSTFTTTETVSLTTSETESSTLTFDSTETPFTSFFTSISIETITSIEDVP